MKRILVLVFSLMTLLTTQAQYSTGFGKWNVVYSRDEFGDIQYDSPILGCDIPSTSNKGFILNIGLADGGFYFQVYSSKYAKHSFDSTVIIKIKNAQNKIYTFEIPTSNMSEDMLIIDNSTDIKRMANLLNSGNVRISVSGHLSMNHQSNSPTVYSFLDTNQTKDLYKAIELYFR